jgi:hypothetical protein
MRTLSEYYLKTSQPPDSDLARLLFHAVWRSTFSAPGFYLLDFEQEVDSRTIRAWMLALKRWMSEECRLRTGGQLVYRSMARFDQQETTKFHIDGAPAKSMLMLGYESSLIRSRLFLADYSRAAFDLSISPQQFLQEFNPMYSEGEKRLTPYVTELPPAQVGDSRILLINNSSLPFSKEQTNPLGVMHKAEIINPCHDERRIVNSTMIVTEGPDIDADKQDEFVATDRISQKNY